MALGDEALGIEPGAVDFEEKPKVGRWLVLGAVLFVVAFVFGWRSLRKADASSSGDPK